MTPTTTQGRDKPANWWENDPIAPEQPSASASGNWWESDPVATDIELEEPGASQPRNRRTAGDVAADLAKGFGGAAVSAVGAVPTAVGRAVQEGGEMLFGMTMDEAKRLAEAEGTPEKALEWYERANRLNPVSVTGRAIESGGRWVSRQGDRLRDARSDEAKELARQSTPDGDITRPSTWTMGENPTIEGVAQVAADVMGSMVPPVATAIATRGRSATTQIRAGGATVIDPIVALMQNKDWTGKPIYRENANSLDPQPGHRLVKDSASTPSRAVAEAINKITGGTDYRPGAWSPTPDQLDYIIGQLTGGLGRELLKVNQTLSSTVTGDELPPYKIPLVGRLYGNTRGPAGQSGRYYENVRLLNEIENEYKGRLRNREDVTELRENEPLVGLIGLGNATENQVRRLNTLRRQITERKEEGYKERVKEIDARVAELMTRLNTEVAKARREAAR